MERAGGRCEYTILVHGPDHQDVEARCIATTDLQAHHDQAGYTPDCGRLLCRAHHKAEDRYAR